jgi:prefoldin subunit 5
MAGEIQVTEGDIAEVLRAKVNEITGLQVQAAALARTVNEKQARIDELEGVLASLNGKESTDAEGGEAQIPVYNKG